MSDKTVHCLIDYNEQLELELKADSAGRGAAYLSPLQRCKSWAGIGRRRL
jgi:hypothetical protein